MSLHHSQVVTSKAQAQRFCVLSSPGLWYATDSILTYFSILNQQKNNTLSSLSPLEGILPQVISPKGLSERSNKPGSKKGSRNTWVEQYKTCNRAAKARTGLLPQSCSTMQLFLALYDFHWTTHNSQTSWNREFRDSYSPCCRGNQTQIQCSLYFLKVKYLDWVLAIAFKS